MKYIKKNFQIIITCAALVVLFFNHYDLNYKCLEWSNGSVAGHIVLSPKETVDSTGRWQQAEAEVKCVKFEKFPTLTQESLRYWDTQIFPDLFVILIYFAVIFFTKNLTFKFKKKIKNFLP